MVFANGLMLGVANGGTCIAYCAPVLVPYLVGEGTGVRANVVSVGGFLGGRLVGYTIFAILAWVAHVTIIQDLPHRGAVFGGATIVLSLVLIFHGFLSRDHGCTARSLAGGTQRRRGSALVPAGLGLLTGVNVCPPFMLALVDAAQLSQVWQSLFFFGGFFVGTSIYMAVLPWVGLAGRCERIRVVARLATGVVGLFYLCSGILNVIADVR